MSKQALLEFLKDVPSVLLVFGDSKQCILEPRGARGENFCSGSSNLHPTPKKPSKSDPKSVPTPSSGASQDSWNGLPKAATLKIRFLRRAPLWGSRGFEPRTWEMGPRLYIDIYIRRPLERGAKACVALSPSCILPNRSPKPSEDIPPPSEALPAFRNLQLP